VKRRVFATLVATLLAVVACGGEGEVIEPPVRFATPAELTGPWRATPLILDPALRARVADVCRREIELPPGTVPAVVDARGERVVTVRMTGANEGSCDALELAAPDGAVGAGGGWQRNAQRLPAAPDTEITQLTAGRVGGGGLTVEGRSVHGQAGAAISVVQVAVADGLVVTATLENGWFSAWWPAIIHDEVALFPPIDIRGFDSTGALLDSATSDEVRQ
jgi:hypothetical protein